MLKLEVKLSFWEFSLLLAAPPTDDVIMSADVIFLFWKIQVHICDRMIN